MDRLPIAVLVVRWESPPDLGSFRFVYGNPAVQQVTHVPADHFTGFTIHEITPELLETELPARYARVAETGVPDIVRRFSWAPPNMAPEYFDLHLHRIAERTVWITYSNVSDATRTEIELRRQTEELESFAYVISHDLKAPLRGITNLARWIEEDHAESLEREARDHLRKIRERAVSMDELIDGVLAYSRIGRTPFLDPMPISTAALVKSVIASLDVPDDVTLTMVGSFPTVRHSEARLRQVFQNLIENALRFLGEEVRTVEIRCEERPLADGWEFSVRDTGIGIDPKHHERIFQMFQRLPNPSGSMPEVGTGIGLAVAKKAVEDCGGRMTVVSAPGRGSTFSFTVLRHPIRTASSSAVEKP
jgi:light-regulated signal transduction histidine kinase (bacteriophytochrome)